MYIIIRGLSAAIIYGLAWCIIFDMCNKDVFSWLRLSFSIVGFVITYYLWPIRNKSGEKITWSDFITIIIELPYEVLIYPFKLLYRLFKNIDDFDFDFDD